MKLCIVLNEKDSKLIPSAYCSIFKDMLKALVERFDCKCFVVGDCNADQIDADVILFFDPHASHHVNIEGIQNHPAIKMEYWNDMHQEEFHGVYLSTGIKVHKLGAKSRAKRAEDRGTKYIVAGVRDVFHEQFSQYLPTEDMLLFFPHAPCSTLNGAISGRQQAVLGNGATHGGWRNGYDFRAWAFEQDSVDHVKHAMFDPTTPKGSQFSSLLSGYSGALALCTPFPVPKYYELPAAGCVTFAEYHKEYEDLGFKDFESCVYVTRDNFNQRVNDFLGDVESYQPIADAGRKIIEDNYTATHFADFIYTKMESEHETKNAHNSP